MNDEGQPVMTATVMATTRTSGIAGDPLQHRFRERTESAAPAIARSVRHATGSR